MIAMSTVMAKTHPFKEVLGYNSLLAEDGRPMHKSWGNSIEFNEGADKIGADVMRWTFVTHSPADNLLFGYKITDEARRRFLLILWNVYNFFVTYANIDHFIPNSKLQTLNSTLGILDKWILARLNQTIATVSQSLDQYDPFIASHSIEDFVSDLSLWYVRRSRDRVGPSAVDTKDKQAFHSTLHTVFVNLTKVLAPFTPFIADEIYKNLTREESVHLTDWPTAIKLSKEQTQLLNDMQTVRKIAELGLSARKSLSIKVRQPLRTLRVSSQLSVLSDQLLQLIKDELNVKEIHWAQGPELKVELDSKIDDQLKKEGEMRELIRQIQDLRKSLGAKLDQQIDLTLPNALDPEMLANLKSQTLTRNVAIAPELSVELV